MKIALVTSLEGKGLQVDAELVQGLLETWGHEAELVDYSKPWPGGEFDLGICFEVVVPNLFSQVPRWFWFPNCEWVKPEMIQAAKKFDLILAKTRAAELSLLQSFPNVAYTGFLTKDQHDDTVPREKKFLHIGGAGGYRNTPAVIAAWKEYRYWNGTEAENAELTVVSRSTTVSFEETPGIRFIKRASDDEIKQLQNSHLFHLYPSAYEGFGHALHESQSVGAVLLTTNAPPMDETRPAFVVPSTKETKRHLAVLHEVSPQHIREAVPKLMQMPPSQIETMQWAARDQFEKGNAEFTRLFWPLLTEESVTKCAIVSDKKPRVDRCPEGPDAPFSFASKARIAILGNFGAPHSTENDLAWTLTDMGREVVLFQENETPAEKIVEDCKNLDVELMIYVHTHGWETPGKVTLDQMLAGLRQNGTKTASFHLDRYVGLDMLDGRETRVGTHPFWRTDCVFTADGGNAEFFKSRGVNHVWLPPGVVKRECVPGVYRDELAIDVGFVGARGYHPEYPFRGELISFLEQTYGDRFKVFTGFRGQELNDLYASISVVVGDSCFGGSDNYWSDRVPETLGRGGFLIHPACLGLRIPGLVTFEPGNLAELKQKIDFFLDVPIEREYSAHVASNWVSSFETYHNRMAVLLKTMGVSQ